MKNVVIEYYNSQKKIVKTTVTIEDADRIVKAYAEPSEWISVHEQPPSLDGGYIEYAHFSKDKLIKTWVESRETYPTVVCDRLGYTIHPTHWRK